MSLVECGEFEQRIHQILDDRGELGADDDLQAHAAWCSDCRELLHEYRQLSERVVACRHATLHRSPAPLLTAPLLTATGGHRSAALRRGRLALAATLLLGLALGLRDGGSDSARPYLASQDRAVPSAAGSSLENSWRLVQETWASSGELVAEPGTQAIATQAQQLLETIEEIPATLEEIRLAELQPYYVYTASLPGVSTLATPVRLTVDMLRRRWSPQPKTELPSRSERQEWLLQSLRVA